MLYKSHYCIVLYWSNVVNKFASVPAYEFGPEGSRMINLALGMIRLSIIVLGFDVVIA